MAQCVAFFKVITKCNWCGANTHESYKCDKMPRYPGNSNEVNLIMKTNENRSDGRAYFASISIADTPVEAMIDNGASVCLVKESLVNSIAALRNVYNPRHIEPLKGLGNQATVTVKGKVVTPISMANLMSAPIEFLVVENNVMNCSVLLGLNFLEDHYMLVDTTNRTLQYSPPNQDSVSIPLHNTKGAETRGVVRSMSKLCIPARTRGQFRVKVSDKDAFEGRIGYFEPYYDFTCAKGVILANCLCLVDESTIVIEALNMFDMDMTIDKNTAIGYFFNYCPRVSFLEETEQTRDCDITNLFDLTETDLSADELYKVKEVLRKNHLAISKHDGDLGLTSTLTHSIDVQGARLHKLRYRRLQGAVKNEVETELRRLEKDGIIEPSYSAMV